MHRSRVASIALVLLLPPGCGTLLDLHAGRRRGQRVYGGVRCALDPPFGPYLLVAWVDLPFSAVLDTLVLPLTFLAERERRQEEAAEAERIRRRDGRPE